MMIMILVSCLSLFQFIYNWSSSSMGHPSSLEFLNHADCYGSSHLEEATLAHVPGLKAASAHVNGTPFLAPRILMIDQLLVCSSWLVDVPLAGLQTSEAGHYLEAEHAGLAAGRAQARRHGVDGAGEREQRCRCRRPHEAHR